MKDFNTWRERASSLGGLLSGNEKPSLTIKQEQTLAGLSEKNNLTIKQEQTLEDLIKKRDAPLELKTGAISHLEEVFQAVVFGRSYEIKSKYLEKGIIAEQQSMDLYSNTRQIYVQRHKVNEGNDWLTGTPDALIEGEKGATVVDFKTSWTQSSFPLLKNAIPNRKYYHQVQAYMWLLGVDNAELVYGLVDTPHKLVEDGLRRLDWKYNIFDGNGDVLDERRELVVEEVQNHFYTEDGLLQFCHQNGSIYPEWFTDFKEIKPYHRIKVYEVSFDETMIEKYKVFVDLARNQLNKMALITASAIQ